MAGFYRVNATLGVQKLYRTKTGFPIGNRDVVSITMHDIVQFQWVGVDAPAGSRTRGPRMGTEDFTAKLLAQTGLK